jgi:hypothetical protein
MAKLNTPPLAPWIRFFSGFTERTFDRVQEAVDAIEEETYTPARFMSDGVRFWLDITVGWWNAMQAAALTPTPIVFLKILPNRESVKAEPLPVTIGDKTKLNTTPLIRLGGGDGDREIGEKPEADNLEVRMGVKPGCLSVTYHLVPPPQEGRARKELPQLTPGVYQSLVHANNKLVAVVQLLVE